MNDTRGVDCGHYVQDRDIVFLLAGNEFRSYYELFFTHRNSPVKKRID